MKRTIYGIFLLLFLLTAALWTYVQSEAFSKKIRPSVVEEVRRAIGSDARIGLVKATLLPLSLEVRDIVIPAKGSREAVAVRKIKLYLNPFPLIWKTVAIPSMTVLEPRVSAVRSADGTIDIVRLAQEIAANLRRPRDQPSAYLVRLGTIQVKNGTLRVRDEASGSVAVLQRLSLRTRVDLSALRGDLRLTGATLAVSSPSIGELTAALKAVISYDREVVTVASLDLSSDNGRIELSGSAGLSGKSPVNARMEVLFSRRPALSVRGLLGRSLRSGPRFEGAVTISGTAADPIMDGTAKFSHLSAADFRLNDGSLRFSYRDRTGTVAGERWSVSRGSQSVLIDTIDIRTGYHDGKVEIVHAMATADRAVLSASGQIDPRDGYRLSLSADAAGSAAVLRMLTNTDLSGDLAVRGTLSGALASPQFSGTVSAGPLTVRGVTFQSATGLVSYLDRRIAITGATLQHGTSRYLFDGTADLRGSEAGFQARLKVIRSDVVSVVALFYRRIPILLDATGELVFSGTRSDFEGHGRLDLGRGVAYGETFERGTVTAVLTKDRISFPKVLLEKEGTVLSGQGWIGFDGTYDAVLEGKGSDVSRIDRLSAVPVAGPFSLDLRSSGSFTAPVVDAVLRSERLSLFKVPVEHAAFVLHLSGGAMNISAEAGDGTKTAVSARGSMKLRQPFPWSLTGSVDVENLEPAAAIGGGELFARARLSLAGGLKASGEGIAPAGISGEAEMRRLAFTLGDHRIENDGPVVLQLNRSTVTIAPLVLTGAGTRLTVDGNAELGGDLDLTLTGDANLSILRVLSRAVEHADGSAALKLNVRDDWSSPDIDGELVLRNGLLKIKDVPQRFTGLNGSITFDRNRIVSEGISGEVGGGSITLSGSAQISGTTLQDFSTKSVIENVTIRYPPGLTATLGGILYYDGTLTAQTLTGEIGIRKARYERRVEWKSMLVDFSKRFIPQKKTELGWIGETQLNVRFNGRENILFENNLAKVPLEIDMLFRGTVNQVQVLGRIEARKGEVYFRKNTFRILYASADFADPNRINPALDVQAETRVRDYQIRLAVSGTADRAEVTFLSDPPLTDSNILAMLTLGRTGDELKGKEAEIGMSEATSFATGRFQDILESGTRSITGLDRFQIDPYINKYDTALPRVTVGKELMQDRLIMSYSSNIGGSTPEQNIRLEYILNRNVSFLGEYDELGQIGADIKFRFEFR